MKKSSQIGKLGLRKAFALIALVVLCLGGYLKASLAGAGVGTPVDHSKSLDEVTKYLLDTQGATQRIDSIDLRKQAQRRRDLLLETLKRNPHAVLRVALPARIRQTLPEAARPYVEEEVEDVEGRLEILGKLTTDGKNSIEYYLITSDGKKLSLYFTGKPNLPLSGSRIRISQAFLIPGDSGSGALVFRYTGKPDEFRILSRAVSGSFGPQKTIVLLINFQDKPTEQPWTPDTLKTTVFTTLSNHDYESSFHQTSLTGDVIGWYTISTISTASCDSSTDQMASQALAAAKSAGVDLSSYKRQIFIFPKMGNCAWLGLGTIGTGSGGVSQAWINGTNALNVIGHEMGHNFGLYHANACAGTPGASCASNEYADPSDMMGNRSSGHFNAFQKEILGWLNYSASPPILTVTGTGTYTIEPYETFTANPKALKILKATLADGSQDYYYLEYRQPIGFDQDLTKFNSSGGNLVSGILFHLGNSKNRNSSRLLDMNSSTSSFFDSALVPGKTFSDPAAANGGVVVQVNSATASGASVSITLGGAGGGQCVRANPTLTAVPTGTQWMKAGSGSDFTLTLRNNDSTNCLSSTFSIGATPKNGVTSALSASTLVVNPGASATVTLRVDSKTSTLNGVYDVNIVGSNSAAPGYSSSAIASVGITGGGSGTCTPVAPIMTTSPSTPQSVQAGDGYNYTVSIKNGDNSACAASTFQFEVTAPEGVTGTLASTSIVLDPGSTGTVSLQVDSMASTQDGTYTVGVTGTNSTSGLTGSTHASIQVSGGGGCVRANPTLTTAPTTTQWVQAGQAANFSIKLTNNDTGVCKDSTFSLAVGSLSNVSAKLTSKSLTVRAGSSATVYLRADSSTSTPNGTYPIQVTGTHTDDAQFTGTTTASFGVKGGGGGGGGTCLRGFPVVTLIPGSQSAAPGKTVNYTVSVKNSDTGCGETSFQLTGNLGAGLIGSIEPQMLSLAPGETRSSVVSVTSLIGATAGFYGVEITATNSAAVTYKGTYFGTYFVIRDPSTKAVH